MISNDHFQKNYLKGVSEYFDLLTALELTTGKSEKQRLQTRLAKRAKMNRGMDELIRPAGMVKLLTPEAQ